MPDIPTDATSDPDTGESDELKTSDEGARTETYENSVHDIVSRQDSHDEVSQESGTTSL